MSIRIICLFSFMLFEAISLSASVRPDLFIKKQDILKPSIPSSVKIAGIVGQRIDSCIQNGVMGKKFELYTVTFRDKLDKEGGFSGEFWGKWFTSAALGYAYQSTNAHRAILDKSVNALLKTQESDGRISSYPKSGDFGYWDIWGRKYVLLGLIAAYDQTCREDMLQAACRATDALIAIAGPGKQKLTETGLQILEGLPSSSILEPVVLLYQRTGEKRYLDFAKYLVSLWSQPGKYSVTGLRLIENALAGKDPISIASPKGYEMMSCYEGLCELYRVTGDKRLLKAVVSFGESVLKKEIMIVGSGSSGELWCDGAKTQTEILEQPMETCVTVTWMKLCYQLLRLTGNPKLADQLEISLYNALFGAMADQGRWWAYFSPLLGERMPSPMQVPLCQSSCCVANGPRGLLITPLWSVMSNRQGPVINLYCNGSWSQSLEDGTVLRIRQETTYPVQDEIKIGFETDHPVVFTVSLRIPEWSKNSTVTVDGKEQKAIPGTYHKIRREWHKGDQIILRLDLRGRIIQSPGSANHLAIMRGPIVLALDNRMVQNADYNLWLLPSGTRWQFKDELGGLKYVIPSPTFSENAPVQYVDLLPINDKPPGVCMAFKVPFLYRYTHFFEHKQVDLVLCDYASAGNQYSEKNLFRVWLPQPLFMNDAFPENTWRILFQPRGIRPVIPKHN